jgi:hypothetical protein
MLCGAGIAIAYLVSPAVVDSDQHNIPLLLQGIAVSSVFMAAITTILFPEDPPLPPSRAQYMKLRAPKPPPESWRDRVRMFQRKGNGSLVFVLFCWVCNSSPMRWVWWWWW